MKNNLLDLMERASIDYNRFRELFADQVENPNLNDPQEQKHFENRKLNWHRTQRLEKTFTPSQELVNIILMIDGPQIWFVITESWCGDSAQILPIIAKAAALNGNINLKIITRDDNPEIMDNYLTNGARSIPILIAFDKNGTQLFQWGPRPKLASDLVNDLKSSGVTKPELYEKLHLWYGKDRGKAFEKELTEIISKSLNLKLSVENNSKFPLID